jgi:predicted transcriptional regulator
MPASYATITGAIDRLLAKGWIKPTRKAGKEQFWSKVS